MSFVGWLLCRSEVEVISSKCVEGKEINSETPK